MALTALSDFLSSYWSLEASLFLGYLAFLLIFFWLSSLSNLSTDRSFLFYNLSTLLNLTYFCGTFCWLVYYSFSTFLTSFNDYFSYLFYIVDFDLFFPSFLITYLSFFWTGTAF
jgi:hypothetical protein